MPPAVAATDNAAAVNALRTLAIDPPGTCAGRQRPAATLLRQVSQYRGPDPRPMQGAQASQYHNDQPEAMGVVRVRSREQTHTITALPPA